MNMDLLPSRHLQNCHPEVAAATEGPAVVASAIKLSTANMEQKQVLRSPRRPQDDKKNLDSRKCTPEGVLHPVPATEASLEGQKGGSFRHDQGRALTRCFLSLIILVALSATALAQSITGTVTNATTGKPAAGDDVSLLSLSQGMDEIGSTKSDAQGKFSFPAPKDQAPHMVRVTHGGVNYFPAGGPIMPGATTAEVTVYDTAKES